MSAPISIARNERSQIRELEPSNDWCNKHCRLDQIALSSFHCCLVEESPADYMDDGKDGEEHDREDIHNRGNDVKPTELVWLSPEEDTEDT